MKNNNLGFSLIEIIIALAIFSIILLVVVSSFFSMSESNLKTKNNREVLQNTRRVLDEMAYEIKSAKSIYTPTTTAGQLSLETSRYLPPNETTTYIDFFLCGTAICLKKEFQDPIVLTSNSINVTNLTFTKVINENVLSVKINLTASYADSSIDLTTTAFLRSY